MNTPGNLTELAKQIMTEPNLTEEKIALMIQDYLAQKFTAAILIVEDGSILMKLFQNIIKRES